MATDALALQARATAQAALSSETGVQTVLAAANVTVLSAATIGVGQTPQTPPPGDSDGQKDLAVVLGAVFGSCFGTAGLVVVLYCAFRHRLPLPCCSGTRAKVYM